MLEGAAFIEQILAALTSNPGVGWTVFFVFYDEEVTPCRVPPPAVGLIGRSTQGNHASR